MNITVHSTFLAHDDPEAAPAFYRDTQPPFVFEPENPTGSI